MSLINLVDNSLTDKNTTHSYLPLYEHLLSSKKESAKNVLEVGTQFGGSIKLWRDYFTNANIYGLDILSIDRVTYDIIVDSRVFLHNNIDAYNENFFKNHFLSKNIKFDFQKT